MLKKSEEILIKFSFEKVLLWIVKLGIFGILFAPLLFHSQFYFPFIVFKNIIFRILVEIVFGAYVLLAILNKNYLPKRNLLVMSVSLFFFIVFATSLFGVNFERSLWGDYERMGGLFGMLHVFGYFIVLVSVFKERKDWDTFFTFSVYVSLVMSLFALAQKLDVTFLLASGGGERVSATIGNPIYLSTYILFHIFLLLYFIFRAENFNLHLFFWSTCVSNLFIVAHDVYIALLGAREGVTGFSSIPILSQLSTHRLFFLILIFLYALTFVAWLARSSSIIQRSLLFVLLLFEALVFLWTQTRGGMLGAYAGLIFSSIIFALFYRGKRYARYFWAAFGIIILLSLALYFARNFNFLRNVGVFERFFTISIIDQSTQARLMTWKASVNGWVENPLRFLIGNGVENFFLVFDRHFPSGIYRDEGSQVWFDHPHNIILDVGVNQGIFGLMTYFFIFWLSFKILFTFGKRSGDFTTSAIFSGVLLAYFVQNNFVFDTIDSLILFYLIMGFMGFLSQNFSGARSLKPADSRSLLMPQGAQSFFFGGAFILVSFTVVFMIYAFNVRVARENREFYSAIQNTFKSQRSYYKNAEAFRSVISHSLVGRPEMRQQFATYVFNVSNRDDVALKDMKFLAQSAIEEGEEGIQEEPNNVKHYLLLSSLYNRFFTMDPSYAKKSEKLMQKAIVLSPTRPQLFIELGFSNVHQGKVASGIAYFEKAARLVPDNKDMQILLLKAYLREKMLDQAQKQLGVILSKNNKSYQLSQGNIEEMIQSYEKYQKYDIMITLYNILAEGYPSPNYFFELARYFAFVGEDKKAESLALRAMRMDNSKKAEGEKFLKELREGKLRK